MWSNAVWRRTPLDLLRYENAALKKQNAALQVALQESRDETALLLMALKRLAWVVRWEKFLDRVR